MKKILTLVASALFAVSGFAQEKAIKNYGFWDNWFIQGQVGGSYTFSEGHNKTNFTSLVTPHIAISAGKYFSPIAGARIQVGGWQSKSKNYGLLNNDKKTYDYSYFQANLDGMLNLTNLFSTYTGDKFFNLYGIMGLGYVHNFGDSEKGVSTQNSIVPRLGLQADFRLNDDLSLNLEAIGNLMNDEFNGRTGGTKYDATTNLLLGLTYRFNKSGFELVDVVDPYQLASLNDQINQQKSDLAAKDRQINQYKSEIERLANRPAVVEEVVTTGETEVLMNAVVVFRLGSAKLEQNQDINIYNAAKYLQQNPGLNITLTGYADKATGTPAINQRLSQQRAQAVADILINKYGIAKNRITVEAAGDKEQPFEIDAWNRVVIFTAHN